MAAGRALATLLAGLALGCGPWGPQGIFGGGPYLGSVAAPPDSGWSFTDDHPLIGIETRGGLFRHSVTILCVSDDGRLYVMARHAPRKRWVQNVEADPRVRLEIGDALYEGRAVRVTDPEEGAAVARGLLRKYVGLEAPSAQLLVEPPAPGDDRAEVWAWRIDPPEEGR